MAVEFKQGAFHDAALVRTKVFLDEQGFQEEFDDLDIDPRMVHLCAYGDGELLGCARLFPSAMESGVEARPDRWILGRLAVLASGRKTGTGSKLMAEAERIACDHGAAEMHLHAQLQAQPFYERLGYAAYGPVELDEHVEHQWMKKVLV